MLEHLARSSWILTVVGLAAAAGAEGSPAPMARVRSSLGADEILVIEHAAIRPTHVYTYHVEGLRKGGGLYRYRLPQNDRPGQLTSVVNASEGVVLDCELSFDAKTVVFSWKKSMKDPFQVFTIPVDGGSPTQLTDGPHHNFNASWLPDGGIVFLSTRNPQFAYCWNSPVGVLHRMAADGRDVRRISANYLNDFTPSVMDSGLILFGRWEYVDRPAIPIQSLWTIRPDGTMLSGFYGNRVLGPASFIEARSIPDGSGRVLCTMTGHNGRCSGAIGIIDPRKGANAQESIENVTPEVDIRSVTQCTNGPANGPYQSPWPLDAESFLVTRFSDQKTFHGGTVQFRTYDGRTVIDMLPGRASLSWVGAQPLRPRPRPTVPSGAWTPLADAADTTWAELSVQDVYNGLVPHVARGEIGRLAVVEEIAKPVRVNPAQRAFGFQFPVVSCGATYAPKKIWGFVDVAADGSAHFKVPAQTPLYFLALDREGRAVQRMRTFTHLMPGEKQGCVGCHADRNNAVASHVGSAARLPAVDLTPPPWGVRNLDYASIVQPVLDTHCVRCHHATERAGGLDLSGDRTEFFNVSYDMLANTGENPTGNGSRYVNWIPTMNGQEKNILEVTPKAWGSPRSLLADVILSGHRDAIGTPRISLSRDERQAILSWIDCNVPYYGEGRSSHLELRGCRQVTYGAEFDKVFADVAARRCAACHEGGTQSIPWRIKRVTNVAMNDILLAPLAKAAGGRQSCGRPVFADTDDPDYTALLEALVPVEQALQRRPRTDMPGARIDPDEDTTCQ
jgi:hypothetical protein